MNDMTAAITPKSDQINADDLISGPRTIRISRVEVRPSPDQPVSIFYDGDGGKPWKPCKSMSRVLVAAWGADANAYVGRSVTLYRDPNVLWGGMAVGGIRISHMSHIERDMVMALTATKGKRAPFKVKPLADAPAREPEQQSTRRPDDHMTHPTATLSARSDTFEAALRSCPDLPTLTRTWQRATGLRDQLLAEAPDRHAELKRVYEMLDAELDSPPADDSFPGDEPTKGTHPNG